MSSPSAQDKTQKKKSTKSARFDPHSHPRKVIPLPKSQSLNVFVSWETIISPQNDLRVIEYRDEQPEMPHTPSTEEEEAVKKERESLLARLNELERQASLILLASVRRGREDDIPPSRISWGGITQRLKALQEVVCNRLSTEESRSKTNDASATKGEPEMNKSVDQPASRGTETLLDQLTEEIFALRTTCVNLAERDEINAAFKAFKAAKVEGHSPEKDPPPTNDHTPASNITKSFGDTATDLMSSNIMQHHYTLILKERAENRDRLSREIERADDLSRKLSLSERELRKLQWEKDDLTLKLVEETERQAQLKDAEEARAQFLRDGDTIHQQFEDAVKDRIERERTAVKAYLERERELLERERRALRAQVAEEKLILKRQRQWDIEARRNKMERVVKGIELLKAGMKVFDEQLEDVNVATMLRETDRSILNVLKQTTPIHKGEYFPIRRLTFLLISFHPNSIFTKSPPCWGGQCHITRYRMATFRSRLKYLVQSLYEGLVIVPDLDPESLRNLQEKFPITPWISVPVSRAPLLQSFFSSTDGAHLARRVKALYIHHEPLDSVREPPHAALEAVQKLLPYFTNLKHLFIESLHVGQSTSPLWIIIPHFISLTHITIGSRSFAAAFSVLQRHPTLRAAVVYMEAGGTPEPDTNLHLPNLRLYSGPPTSWEVILKASPKLEALDDQVRFHELAPHDDLYSNIRFISVGVYYGQLTHPSFSRLKKLEYLRVFVMGMGYPPEELVSALKRIPSPSLKYICILTLEDNTPLAAKIITDSLFTGIASLMVVDLTITRLANDEPIIDERFTRDSPPYQIPQPRPDVFGHWWHDIRDEVEDIGVSNSLVDSSRFSLAWR
ncbi:hypothetical protein ONZ45_g645 [Pleurotus djamor]|nr:hypothetical protein ONZ45_g645 [Pleurotus djamor]